MLALHFSSLMRFGNGAGLSGEKLKKICCNESALGSEKDHEAVFGGRCSDDMGERGRNEAVLETQNDEKTCGIAKSSGRSLPRSSDQPVTF